LTPSSTPAFGRRAVMALLGLLLIVPLVTLSHRPADAIAPGIRGDVDGDGLGDVIHLYRKSNGRLNIWLSRGNGAVDGVPSLGAPVLQHGLSWAFDNAKPAVGDFDGDGRTDLLIIFRRAAGGTNFWMFHGTPTGLAAPQRDLGLSNFEFDKIKHSVGDVDNDGDDDLVIAYRRSTSSNIWQFNGGPSLAAPIRIQSGVAPKWSEIKLPQYFGDSNNDGFADLAFWRKWVVQGETSVRQWVAFGNGSTLDAPVYWQDLRRFLYHQDLMTGGSFSGATNASGARFGDLAVMRPSPPNAGVDLYWVWGGGPTGPFRDAWNGIIGGWDLSRVKMTASDINGDGVDEVVAFYRKNSGASNIWMFYNTDGFTDFTPVSLSHRWSETRPG